VIKAVNDHLVAVARALAVPVYYRVLFGHSFPFSKELRVWVQRWERDRGDVPVDRHVWEHQYLAGSWGFLHDLPELPRYSIVAGYVRYLGNRGVVLDVGCGEGLLALRLKGGYYEYVGVDLSSQAVERARRRLGASDTRFLQMDAANGPPPGRFDIIVFNESLYFFRDPLTVFNRYTAALAPDGFIIVSMFLGSGRAKAILRSLKQRYHVVGEARSSSGANAWACCIFGLKTWTAEKNVDPQTRSSEPPSVAA
jgi:SAM-dependent methyltransferase